MEISIKFSDEELKIIYESLRMGYIHSTDDSMSQKMQELSNKIQMITSLQKK
jgi:hypothetical protein